ncbi:YegS/Rv2252/BmrU family lipid kinase [Bacillus luteolus]|nr:YegS/Rv2252/BmrU family lipid kinase [Cytobacillus luteolus]
MKGKSMKILFFIVNTAASNGKSLKVWRKLVIELDQRKVNYRSFNTKYPGHATELARQIAKMYGDKVAGIICVGGDGTMNEIVNGLVDHPEVKIGFIPAGTGNDFSRGYSLPKSHLDALKVILKRMNMPVRKYDVGKASFDQLKKSHGFVNSLGIGFDAEVSKLANESKIKKYLHQLGLGFLSYVVALMRLLFTYEVTNVTLTIDGNIYRFQNVWFVTISNQSYYGGGMKISPNARPNDGILNITVVHNISRLKLLAVFGSVFVGKHVLFKEVSSYTGEIIRVDSDKPLLIHVDGEQVAKSPVTVTIEKSRMSIIN